MDDVRVVLPRLFPGCHMATWDLTGMYHQVMLDPSITELFGFAIKDEFGNDKLYLSILNSLLVLQQLLVTKLFRPLKLFCHRFGVDQ